MRTAGRGRRPPPDVSVTAAWPFARASRPVAGAWTSARGLIGWRLLLGGQPELLEPLVSEHVAQLDRADVDDIARSAGRRPAASGGGVEAHLVDPKDAVGDGDRKGGAEERLELEPRLGGGDGHGLEHAPPGRVEEDASVAAHLGPDAAA